MNNFPAPIYPGVEFQFHVRHADDNEDLIDITGWSATLVVSSSKCESDELFRYTELDTDVIEIGSFDVDGVENNMRVTVSADRTEELRSCDFSCVYVGLLASSPDQSTVVYFIPCAKAVIAEVLPI